MSDFEPVGINPDSDFPPRVEERLAGKFAGPSRSYTKNESDNKYPTKTEFNNGQDAQDDAIAGLDGRLDTAEALTNSGRLSEDALDDKYLQIPEDVAEHAIFIGSSNANAGYGWTQNLSNKRGWIHHNYSIGGGAFGNPSDPSSFRSQILTAVADNTFNKLLVKFVFIVDMSNDMRGLTDVTTFANEVYSIARTNYPNARIIVVPAVWTYVHDNMDSELKRVSAGRRYTEAVNGGRNYDVEVIVDSWLWFWDGGGWLEGIEPNFHLNNAGYNRLVWYIEQYLDNGDWDNRIPFTDLTMVASEAQIGANGLRCGRSRGVASIQGSAATYTEVAIDTVIGRIPKGCAPINKVAVTMVGSDRNDYAVYINWNCDISAVDTIPGGLTLWLSASWLVA